MYDARCRAPRAERSLFCDVEHKKGDLFAPPPDTVLVRFRINSNTEDLLIKAGLSQAGVTPQNVQSARTARHVESAAKMGINSRLRPGRVDSGTAVFLKEDGTESSEGAKDVTLGMLIKELGAKKFRLQDVHILSSRFNRRKKHSASTIVLSFGKIEAESFILEHGAQDEINALIDSSWTAHIWVNPRSNGKIVHTINLVARSDQSARHNLTFDNGLWGIVLTTVVA